MFKNFFKIAFRNLWKNKGFSLINISGLAIGMASAMLLLLWIYDEISFDRFHEKRDRIYEVWNRAEFSGELHCWNTTPKVLARTMEHDFPEVESAVRVNWPSNYLFTIGEKRIMVQGNIVDSAFLDMFSFPLVRGNPHTALLDMHSVVLTEKLAEKLFGKEDPMGKLVKIDNKETFRVTGLARNPPGNTRFQFEYLIPWSYLHHIGGDDTYWGNNSTRTYVMLKPNASLASVQQKMRTLKGRYDKEETKWEMFLYPMSRWRLYSNFNGAVEDGGRIEFVKLSAIIAAFILLIACINFMNLNTARSEKRAKEVGIRKVVGASRGGLITQFLGESVLLSFFSALLAIGLVALSISSFNQVTDKNMDIPFDRIGLWALILGFIFFTGVLAGSYPAFFLSSFRPVKVLKGGFKKVHALVTPRKVLVVLQFGFAILLIICTIIVQQQINHAQDRETGYDKNNLVYHFLTGDTEKNYSLIKNELISSGAASSVTKTSAPITQAWSDSWGFEWEGKDPNDKTDFDRYSADEDFLKTTGLQLVKGRDLDLKKFITDSTAMILNESAVKAMKFKEPIGQLVKDGDIQWHVIGVVKDFILRSPYEPTHPMIIEGGKGWFNVVHIKLSNLQPTSKSLKQAEAIFKKFNPEFPFEYHFVDEDYASKFRDEKRTAVLAAFFSGLTIFISCLGLFGLATYMAETRIKEIGIRKVLGASVTGIGFLISKDFLRLVFIAFLIAAPVAGWAMEAWLKNYPYRVNIHWWVFALAGGISIFIALVTISYQAIRAAVANPVKSLRSE
ncbi:MAG TPA: ABC transporter permease [Chitinophagaceae bacterium]|nr:ABC transporter permease [Chitinophagaceae bacterium]